MLHSGEIAVGDELIVVDEGRIFDATPSDVANVRILAVKPLKKLPGVITDDKEFGEGVEILPLDNPVVNGEF